MIIPAIDIQNGEAVRLYKGDYLQKTVYSKNPAELAKQFEQAGTKYLHVVDLDGAKEGRAVNSNTVLAIRESTRSLIQVGGGIRNAETVSYYLDELRINRVILGTSAIQNPAFVRAMLEKYGASRIVIGVDARNGIVKTGGWLNDGGVDYLHAIEQLKEMGARFIVLTDISRDGTLTSPNWEMYEKVKGMNVIVSGGVSGEQDIRQADGYYGVIVGKAYYEGKVDLTRMMKKRIIPCLDIKDGKVVKGVHFEGLSDIGDPVEIAKRYEEQGADEIVLLDITATNEGRDSIYPLIERIAGQVHIPVTVGGGIRNTTDIRRMLEVGVDKVSVNSAFVNNLAFISEASAEFGRNRIVAAIDGKQTDNGYHVFIRGGQVDTGLDLISWAQKCEELGVGEILLTSMDGDGTQNGYDIPMTKAVAECVGIPVIASGGCGKIGDIITVFKETACDAALVASLVHYGKATVAEVKSEMERNHIPCVK